MTRRRNTRLDAVTLQAICDAAAQGHTVQACAHAAGVSSRAIYGWLARADEPDKDPDGRYSEFASCYRAAKAHAHHKLAGYVLDAAPKDWRAALAVLERRYPAEWSKTWTHKVSAQDGQAMTFVVQIGDAPPSTEPKDP